MKFTVLLIFICFSVFIVTAQEKFSKEESRDFPKCDLVNDKWLDLNFQVDFFRADDGSVYAPFTVELENKNILLNKSHEEYTSILSFTASFREINGKEEIFEDKIFISTTENEFQKFKLGKTNFVKTIYLKPGKYYRYDVALRNITRGNCYVKAGHFNTPKYSSNDFSNSTLIVSKKIEDSYKKQNTGKITIKNKQVTPNLSRKFHRGENIAVLFQIYNAKIDETTQKPLVDIEYEIKKNGKTVYTEKENQDNLTDSEGVLTISKTFSSDNLSSGEYKLYVNVRDRVTNNEILQWDLFNIIESKAQNYFPFTCSNEKPSTEKAFKKWVDIDVNYIMTKAEKKNILNLKTDEDRNGFIDNFWLRRDPDPDTEENEFRGEYCDRLIETIQFDAGMIWSSKTGHGTQRI